MGRHSYSLIFMKFFLIYIIFLALSFCTGPQSIRVIQNAYLLGNSATGLALNHNLNPANIEYGFAQASFSKNNSIYDLEGQKISFLNKSNKRKIFFSFESLSSSSIPIYDETTSDDNPLGYFDTYWYALEVSQSIKLNDFIDIGAGINLGYKLKASLYKLFTKKTSNYTIDLGLSKKINENISLGFVINNIGSENVSSFGSQISGTYDGKSEVGFGMNYLMSNKLVNIASDVYYRNNKIVNKISIETDFPIFNILMGKTFYKGYEDFCYGFSIDFFDWVFTYGYLSFDDPVLGDPHSIQIIRKF